MQVSRTCPVQPARDARGSAERYATSEPLLAGGGLKVSLWSSQMGSQSCESQKSLGLGVRDVESAVGRLMARGRHVALIGLSVFFVIAGANHFLDPDFYLRMMPGYLPAHGFLVAFSGLTEMGLGVAVLAPSLRQKAGWGLIGLLVVVFPANLHMALNPAAFPGVPVAALYARLPVQGLFLFWSWWATCPGPTKAYD